MTNDHSRFSLVENPPQNPGVCWISHTPQGPFIDTGVDVQFAQRGHIYISVDILREMAGIAGLLDEGESADTEIIREQGYALGYAAGLKENVDGNLASIVEQLGIAAAAFDIGGSDSVDALEVAETKPEPELPSVDAAESKPEGTGSTPRQNGRAPRKPRSANVPAASGNESFRI